MGNNIRWLRAFYFLFYGLQGISIPFLPLWFASRGLDTDLIGLIVATAFLPKILSAPLLAHVADVTGRLKVLIAAPLATTALLFACYPWLDAPAWVFWATLGINMLFPAVQPVLDRIALSHAVNGRPVYTTVRVWGSIGFAATTLAGGYVIRATDPLAIVIMSALLTLTCAIYVRALPGMGVASSRAAPVAPAAMATPTAPAAAHTPPRSAAPGPRWPMLQVLRDNASVLAILAASLTQASNGFLYSYASLFWTDRGLSTSDIGLLWTVGVTAEVVFFYFAARIVPRVGAERLIWISALLTAVRWLGLAFCTSLAPLLGLQLLQAFTLAGNNSAVMSYIARRVPPGCQTSAIALYAMLSGGVLMFFSVNAARLVYPQVSWGGFGMMALFALCAVPLVLWAARLGRAAAPA
ncbi:MFS transporter [Pseudomonadota bacterium AL_CKDN230030165-1A_HGKHYDSX7]